MLEEESSQPFDFWVVWGKRGRVIFVGSISQQTYNHFFRMPFHNILIPASISELHILKMYWDMCSMCFSQDSV